MRLLTKKKYTLSGAFLLLFSASASAHFPLMHCWFESANDNQNIVCETGYSDGSNAVDYEVKLYDYDDNLLAKKMTDKRSIAAFSKPDTDFYIVFDSGHESPVEVDIIEISEK